MICKKCGKEKSIIEFYKHETNKSGHDNYCKVCRTEITKKRKKHNFHFKDRCGRKISLSKGQYLAYQIPEHQRFQAYLDLKDKADDLMLVQEFNPTNERAEEYKIIEEKLDGLKNVIGIHKMLKFAERRRLEGVI